MDKQHKFPAGGGPPARSDEYLIEPNQRELGVKKRGGGGVEIKTLIETGSDSLSRPPFNGPMELWCKAKSSALPLNGLPLIVIEKERRLRKFDTTGAKPIEIQLIPDSTEKPIDGRALPSQGCNVEFTSIRVQPDRQAWWTFGFEAFGPLSTVKHSLNNVARMLAERLPPALTDGILESYPTWLTDHLNRSA